MPQRRNAMLDKFFNALISGDRAGARAVVDEALDADYPASTILTNLFWPTLQQIQQMHRHDQLSELAHNYATRLLFHLEAQMQLRLPTPEEHGSRVLLTSGQEASEELAGQMATDLLEAAGYEVYFAGGGIANDEVVDQISDLEAQKLVVFGAVPQTVPETRLLIDRLHSIGACPNLQIVVGGGVFNRADGLAQEIGADLWAHDPAELVQVMLQQPERRMSEGQRTVGRKRARSQDKQAEAA
jgi:methanogenic corrinoid protein MtbC1